ncbi:MAG: 5'-methylthioadenosine/adenosylhomocysteine nucleosidase, partial [Flavobacteriaceae bacterium]|nr:5'-methylthioadenosine/adenosylhomocysteine nucleosidase [Flavobacteriaceae bacterium]
VKGQRSYFIGVLFNTDVVIVFSRWGKVASAATTTQLINDYNPSEIIFTGVAGGIDTHLNIGDIVIGKNLYQHDVDASPFFQKFHIPILNIKSVATQNQKKLIAASSNFIEQYDTYINKDEKSNFDISSPKVILGDIASGDQFIACKSKIESLKKELPTVVCVEMEGAAVAQVCFEYEVPFSIIRIISDKASDSASIDFIRFVNAIASKYALGILENYLS